jgi:hypothetical protein
MRLLDGAPTIAVVPSPLRATEYPNWAAPVAPVTSGVAEPHTLFLYKNIAAYPTLVEAE